MSCKFFKRHIAILQIRSTYIYLIKLGTLGFDNHAKPYHVFSYFDQSCNPTFTHCMQINVCFSTLNTAGSIIISENSTTQAIRKFP